MSSVYSDIGGSVAAAKLAVKDFGAAAKRVSRNFHDGYSTS
jgi:hypothetical protein